MKKRTTITATLTTDSNSLQVTLKQYIIQNKSQNLISEKTLYFPLREVTEKKLLALRANKKSGLIVKIEDTCFFTSVPKEFRLTSSSIFCKKDTHLCTSCPHFFPSPNYIGGCNKVFDATDITEYLKLGYKKEEALIQCKRIEKYDFISLGFELINTNAEFLVVTSCTRCKNAKK